ncbi:MAG: hypothetical protein RBR06_04255 [Desulfuromonadaceae bacterium]|nr:hypothetical protein [Desulfuromonadaceae bacterium]
MKKLMVLIVALAFLAGLSTVALAKTYSGEVTKVSGNKVTIDVGSKAGEINKGDNVKLDVKKGSKPSAAGSALVGC